MELQGEALGRHNRNRILEWLSAHPGAKQGECARALGLSLMAVNRHFRKIRADWSSSAIPPPVEGDLSTRRHWVIVKEPGKIADKKGPFRWERITDFVREVIACHSRETAIVIASLTWDYDLWLEEGRQHVFEADLFGSMSPEELEEALGGGEQS